MLFPFEMFTICTSFLNMAMSIYTSKSNTCISQDIPEYQNAGFEVKTKIFWWGF